VLGIAMLRAVLGEGSKAIGYLILSIIGATIVISVRMMIDM
jgi:hypothetical protein